MARWFGLVARLVVGGVWIVAGALKLPDPHASVQAVRAYQLLPGDSAVLIGNALPAVEVVLGALLVLGVLTRPAAAVSAALMLAFVVGIASVWARGIEIDCGCFGGGGPSAAGSSAYPLEIARDLALFAASVWLVVRRDTALALEHLILRPTRSPQEIDHG
jgi:uncharacterized membrane protein YphA (DoxX/SURF4 family)